METEISIREAEADDWEPAMEIAWKTFLKYEAPDYGKEGTENFLQFISGEQLFKMFLSGEYKMAVAKSREQVIGVATLRTGNHISLLFVDENYHKMGIGRKLLAFLQSRYVVGGKQMTVNSAPYAVNFYEKLGFIKTDDIKKSDGIIYQPMRCLQTIK